MTLSMGNEHQLSILERTFLRVAVELQAGTFPLKTHADSGIFKNKLLLGAKSILKKYKKNDKNRHLTVSHLKDLQSEEGCNNLTLLVGQCRNDEISHAILRYTLENSSVDVDPWFQDDEQLVLIINYMVDNYIMETLVLSMSKATVFKDLFRKTNDIVDKRRQDEAEEQKRISQARLDLSNMSFTRHFLGFPYDKIIANLTSKIFLDRPGVPLAELVKLTMAVNDDTIMDFNPEVEENPETTKVWLLLSTIKILFSLRSPVPRGFSSCKKIVQALDDGRQVYACTYTCLLPEYIFLKCFRCSMITSSRRNLLRHIKKVHHKEQEKITKRK